jgi:predicted RNA-binding Zn ribbon-like protein
MTATRPPPIFIADNPGLDFLNTIAVPVDTKVEWLTSGEDLLAWLKRAGSVPDEVLDAFRRNTVPGELDGLAAQARALRDWFKPFVYKHLGRPLEPAALGELEPLNQLLARDEAFGQIVARDQLREQDHDRGPKKSGTSGLAWSSQRRWQSPESVLLPIARSLALLFIDRTRGHARRWCSMAVCGNRAKQAAHRNRRKWPH